ncbi:hypothetical protein ACFVG1_09335 [Streptomyces bacillaris]|uniref:hypothetical protein n=2 Tax=Streptomyces bacillaris TaxID=68179 RepID=UPI0036429711
MDRAHHYLRGLPGGSRLPDGCPAGAGLAGGPPMMRCDRCDQPITPEQAERFPIDGASGGGGTAVVHRDGCEIARAHPVSYPQERR